ncbi:MAG TPA: DUF2318 domain-containing protein [Clostridiaceae bacterium]|nr:DUF2318 domain-containing protein [Clostridiaceae bacterium]
MSKSNQKNRNVQVSQKSKNKIYLVLGVVGLLIAGIFIFKFSTGGADKTGSVSGDLKILKNEVTENAKFYPYKAGRINMEVMAVKASDGTIRTAFNTCQVCFASGRGYYKQQGDELICQNCGNRFKIDQIEKIRGGCNPVPITKENKTEDEESIVIPQVFMEEYKELFRNWKK